MIRPTTVAAALFALAATVAAPPAGAAAAKKWKPHAIHIIPGVPLKPEDIKPYVPPKLPPEPPVDASEVKTVEVTEKEAVIEIRPWSSPMVGNAIHGARLPIKGTVKSNGHGCSARVWYALEPFGYLCGREARPTDQPPTTEQVLHVREGSRVPFQYVMLLVKEGVKVPMWATVEDLKNGAEPERQLERGDTVAIEKPFIWDGEKFWISVDGKVMPQKGAALMGGGSEWHGLALDDKTPLPFGWVTPDKANAYETPPEKNSKAPAALQIERRSRVQILDEQVVGKKKWLKVKVVDLPPVATTEHRIFAAVPGAKEPPKPEPEAAAPAAPPAGEFWVSADSINEVRKLDKPKTVPDDVTKWIDVDLGEQVLVAYEADRPVFATLVSSGRAIATPMGTYPVWAKVSAITMKNQPYEDKEYFVNKVPWSTFFQWHNAIHGAYWHDKFGVTKSHGCVNVAPLDARHVFEWVTPPLPAGWTGLRPLDLLASPTVVVRNSHMKKQFRQDRPIGPPDRALEGERLEEAEKRRADEAQASAANPNAANPNANPAANPNANPTANPNAANPNAANPTAAPAPKPAPPAPKP
jgi:lipoprotein-anchoring transpeptidase ErfK/SrfK